MQEGENATHYSIIRTPIRRMVHKVDPHLVCPVCLSRFVHSSTSSYGALKLHPALWNFLMAL